MKADAPLAVPARRTGSMAARMAWLYAGSTALLLLIAVTFVYFGLVRSLRRQDERLLASKTRVLRLLLRDPLHTKVLESEIEHEAGEDQALKYYIRVLDARLHPLHSTPEMDRLMPSAAFPPVADDAKGSAIAEVHHAGRDFLLLSADAMALGPEPQRRTIQIALDTSMNRQILGDTRHWLLFAFGAGTVFAALAGLVVTRDGLRPLREIAAATQSVSASRLNARLHPEAWPAELQNLAAAYDAMLDRLQASFNRLSDFSGDLAHALRNPLQTCGARPRSL